MIINVFCEVDIPIKEEVIRKFAECICQKENMNVNINVVFIDKESIKNMNNQYRRKDYPTDVLSFDYGDSGEIYICPEVAYKNAKENGNDYINEILTLVAHGILHIKGYTHETMEKYKKMISLQEEYIRLCYP